MFFTKKITEEKLDSMINQPIDEISKEYNISRDLLVIYRDISLINSKIRPYENSNLETELKDRNSIERMKEVRKSIIETKKTLHSTYSNFLQKKISTNDAEAFLQHMKSNIKPLMWEVGSETEKHHNDLSSRSNTIFYNASIIDDKREYFKRINLELKSLFSRYIENDLVKKIKSSTDLAL